MTFLQVIVRSDRVRWPNGLALDLAARRVYWIEASPIIHGIYSTDYWGHDFDVVFSSSEIKHPFSLAIRGNWLFWTDWDNMAVYASDQKTNALHRVMLFDGAL